MTSTTDLELALPWPDHANPWGWEASIDLRDCDHGAVSSEETLRKFLRNLVDAIDMQAYGDPLLAEFGAGSLHGWTGVQLIHTSNLTVHLAPNVDRAFINVFSCKLYDPRVAVGVAVEHFGGVPATLLNTRG